MRGIIIFVAQYLIILSVIATIVVFLYLKKTDKKVFVIRLIIGGISALIIAYLARHLYSDPRPFVADNITPYFSHSADNGFVSDHTLLATFLGASCFAYYKKTGIALFILGLIIGSARVISGVHHWIDIASAAIISLIAAVIGYYLSKIINKKLRVTGDVK